MADSHGIGSGRRRAIGGPDNGNSEAPFSPGVIAQGPFVMASGQGGFDPDTGALTAGSIEEQTEQALLNVGSLLERAGSSLDDVVSCLVHLADLDLYPGFNRTYERFFEPPRPARTTVGAELLLGMLVEITVVADLGADGGG